MIDPKILSDYECARRSGGLFDFSYRGKIRVSGKDHVSFLHRMLTNDIASLTVGQGCYAAFLTAQSKIITDMNVLRFENHILLTVEPPFTQITIEALQKFVIMDDVIFEDISNQISAIAVFGSESESMVRNTVINSTIPDRLFSHEPVLVDNFNCELVKIPFYGMSAWVFLIDSEQKNHFLNLVCKAAESKSIGLIEKETKEILRLEAGVPICGIDFDEHHLLMETGIASHTVSFTKGCYPGQELVARMDSRSQFAKKLALIECFGSNVPKAQSKILKNSKEIGMLSSAVYSPKQEKILAIGTIAKNYLKNQEWVEILDENQPIPGMILKTLA